jgi:hypothetical protein
LAAVPETERDVILAVFEIQKDLYRRAPSIDLERLFAKCLPRLQEAPDFQRPRERGEFLGILLYTFRFLENRMNLTRANYPRQRYLFAPDPQKGDSPAVERDLQLDYAQWMSSALHSAPVRVEVSDVAGGRADVHFTFANNRYIAEVKQDAADCSMSALKAKYLGQAAEYLSTNVRLGLLLVLDLTDKPTGMRVIEANVDVMTDVRNGDDAPRSVVVVTVPGNRRTPSAVVTNHGTA